MSSTNNGIDVVKNVVSALLDSVLGVSSEPDTAVVEAIAAEAVKADAVKSSVKFVSISPSEFKTYIDEDGRGVVEALGVRYGSVDELDETGDYFSAKTNFGVHRGNGAMATFNHRMPIQAEDDDLNNFFEKMADHEYAFPIESEETIEGLAFRHILDLANEYEAWTFRTAKGGGLRWSSGSAPQVVKRAPDGHLDMWAIIEAAYTPTPAESRLPKISEAKTLAALSPKLLINGDNADTEVTETEVSTPQEEDMSNETKDVTVADEAVESAVVADAVEATHEEATTAEEVVKADEVVEDVADAASTFATQEEVAIVFANVLDRLDGIAGQVTELSAKMAAVEATTEEIKAEDEVKSLSLMGQILQARSMDITEGSTPVSGRSKYGRNKPTETKSAKADDKPDADAPDAAARIALRGIAKRGSA